MDARILLAISYALFGILSWIWIIDYSTKKRGKRTFKTKYSAIGGIISGITTYALLLAPILFLWKMLSPELTKIYSHELAIAVAATTINLPILLKEELGYLSKNCFKKEKSTPKNGNRRKWDG